MNAISLLKADHRNVEALFDAIEKLDGSPKRKRALVDKLVRELSIHSSIEEQIFYPEVKREIDDAKGTVLESLEEHRAVKWMLDAVDSSGEDDERWDAKIKVLRDTVMHHIEEEENVLFPRVRKAFDNSKLNELGAMLERAKKTAPTHPHPRAPDEPPGNVVANMGAAVVDRVRDAARAMTHRRDGATRAKEQRASSRASSRPTRASRAAGASRSSRAKRTTAGRQRSAHR